MSRAKPKIPPTQAKAVWINGPVVVMLEPDEFLDCIAGKDLPIILFECGIHTGRGKPPGTRYEYYAVDNNITYRTWVLFDPLPIHASIQTELIRLGGAYYTKSTKVRRNPPDLTTFYSKV
jgi:hypothetical protein